MPASLQERIGEIVDELASELDRLRSKSERERHLAYAGCIPLLTELDQLNRAPLPVRELKILTHEAGWHLRSLAGLATRSAVGNEKEHADWARASLQGIARCAGL